MKAPTEIHDDDVTAALTEKQAQAVVLLATRLADQKIIGNERTKFLANALDRASTACVAAAFIGPGVNLANHSATAVPLTLATGLGTVCWLVAAFVLHYLGRRALGGLKS